MKIAVGSDHCGYKMKMQVLPYLEKNHEIIDYGCYSTDMVDFPDIASRSAARSFPGKPSGASCFAAPAAAL